MAILQNIVNGMRRIFPRGWAPLLSSIARFIPYLWQYRARLLNGDFMYLDLREYMCFGLFFYGDQPHEMGTEKLLRRILKKGDTFVDIGANVGYYTRIASKLVGEGGTVYAFEPMPAAFRLLKMNCADLPNVLQFQIALSDKKQETTFYIQKAGNLSSLCPDPIAHPVHVSVSTLDDVLANCAKIDVIKIDVEGFELEVIQGGQKTLSTHKPILYFELEHIYEAKRGFNFQSFKLFFDELNYVLKWIDHSETSILFSDSPSTYVVAIPESCLDRLQ
jgi:FkbM family methyltransferase